MVLYGKENTTRLRNIVIFVGRHNLYFLIADLVKFCNSVIFLDKFSMYSTQIPPFFLANVRAVFLNVNFDGQ